MNVLIIEDERALAQELEIFLTNYNYICDVCFDGTSASEKIAVNLYDFILIDLGLPDYDGLDLLKEARNMEEILNVQRERWRNFLRHEDREII